MTICDENVTASMQVLFLLDALHFLFTLLPMSWTISSNVTIFSVFILQSSI